MRKDNGDPNWAYWEDRKLNGEFSIHFSHGGRIAITPDNNEEILAAAKKLYGGWDPEEEYDDLENTEHDRFTTPKEVEYNDDDYDY